MPTICSGTDTTDVSTRYIRPTSPEYADGRYISYLALGNRFSFGKWALELDLMNRAAAHRHFIQGLLCDG